MTDGPGRWQRSAPTVRATVMCGGQKHEVLWRRGALATAHHDLAAEETLTALGGDVPACLEVVRAWRAARVEAAPTPWVWFPPSRLKGRLTARVRSQGDAALPEPLRRTRLLTLHLGGSQSRDDAGEIAARARPGLAAALPRGVELAVVGGSGRARLERHRGRDLLVLPTRWLTHVWARTLEVVDGEFIADAARGPGTDGTVRALALSWVEGSAVLEERRLATAALAMSR